MSCCYFNVVREYRGDPNSSGAIVVEWEECSKGADSGIPEYCSGDGYYCPRRGGDDRFRNPYALTESACDAILREVRQRVGAACTAMRQLLSDVSRMVGRTGYEPLISEYQEAGMRRIQTPVIYNYADWVPTDMEKNRAYELQEQLNSELEAFQPADFLPPMSGFGGELDVGSGDFESLLQCLSSFRTAIEMAISCDKTILGYADRPAAQALIELTDQTESYLRGLEDGFSRAWSTFERGVRYSLGDVEYSDYSGSLPRWR